MYVYCSVGCEQISLNSRLKGGQRWVCGNSFGQAVSLRDDCVEEGPLSVLGPVEGLLSGLGPVEEGLLSVLGPVEEGLLSVLGPVEGLLSVLGPVEEGLLSVLGPVEGRAKGTGVGLGATFLLGPCDSNQ